MSYPALEGEERSLHEKLVDAYTARPFSYDEAERRFGRDAEHFSNAFNSTVGQHAYRHDTFDAQPAFLRHIEPAVLQTLVGLRDAIDETDSWHATGFHSSGREKYGGKRYMDRYREVMAEMDGVPELTDERLEKMYDSNLLSEYGGISTFTDKGWLAIYSSTDEDVYWLNE